MYDAKLKDCRLYSRWKDKFVAPAVVPIALEPASKIGMPDTTARLGSLRSTGMLPILLMGGVWVKRTTEWFSSCVPGGAFVHCTQVVARVSVLRDYCAGGKGYSCVEALALATALSSLITIFFNR